MHHVRVKLKSRIAVAKTAFNKKTLFINKYDLNLRNKPVKCYIWSIALYGAETWTLRKEDQRYPGRFEMWCWRRLKTVRWTDHEKIKENFTEFRKKEQHCTQ